MPDSPIHDLTRASQVDSDDLLVLEQDGEAKKLEAQYLLNYVYERTDVAHGATSILPIISAPSSYTTPVQGFRPAYRIAISDVVSQSGVNSVLVGDQLRYDSFLYPIGYVDATYAYLGPRVSIKGDTGATVGSNRNLLDNAWFTVNQRNETSLSPNGYKVDRWITYNASGSIGNSGITLSAGSVYQILEQSLVDSLAGKTLTASAIVDGVVVSSTATMTTSGVLFDGFQLALAPDRNTFSVYKHGLIRAVKLEVGPVSTLVNDTVPDLATELINCVASVADPSDTYANKSFNLTSSNQNLLDNGWFVVNQRRVTDLSTNGSICDRWMAHNSSGSISLNNGYVKLTSGSIFQFIRSDLWGRLRGKTVTVSIRLNQSNNNILSGTVSNFGTATYPSENPNQQFFIQDSNTFSAWINTDNKGFNISANASNPPSIVAVKLELGSVSTLANDVEPDYSTELLRCMRYLYQIQSQGERNSILWTGYCPQANVARFTIHLPTEMWIKPGIYSSAWNRMRIYAPSASNPSTWVTDTLNNATTIEVINTFGYPDNTASAQQSGKNVRDVVVQMTFASNLFVQNSVCYIRNTSTTAVYLSAEVPSGG